MTFDWREFQAFARTLDVDPLTEVNARCAISRAYYAAFCSARNFLRDQDGDTSILTRGNIHDYVRRQFQDSPQTTRKRIGVNLGQLKRLRQNADYDDVYTPTSQTILMDMRLSLSMADYVLTALQTLPPQRRQTP